MFGVTGGAPSQSVNQPKTMTELEMEAGRRAVARRTWRPQGPTGAAPAKSNGGVVPFPRAIGMARGAAEESAAHATPAKTNGQSITSPLLDFLDDFFRTEKRHLVAIKKNKGKGSNIEARHFEASDRAGQQEFIVECSAAGFDLYFSPNPIKGTLHKKATKNDVAASRHLWIDLDPRKDEPLEAERAAMLVLLTTNLPPGIPPPNRVIDSGRGYWGYWKLAVPQPVDRGELIEAVELYGRGIEQAFGDRFADGCRNIDRIARLPGTVNTKTGLPVCCTNSAMMSHTRLKVFHAPTRAPNPRGFRTPLRTGRRRHLLHSPTPRRIYPTGSSPTTGSLPCRPNQKTKSWTTHWASSRRILGFLSLRRTEGITPNGSS